MSVIKFQNASVVFSSLCNEFVPFQSRLDSIQSPKNATNTTNSTSDKRSHKLN